VCAVIGACGPHELQQVHVSLQDGARSRTNRTRRVPHPVLIGHTASLSQVHVSLQDGARALFAAAHHDYRRAFRYAGEA